MVPALGHLDRRTATRVPDAWIVLMRAQFDLPKHEAIDLWQCFEQLFPYSSQPVRYALGRVGDINHGPLAVARLLQMLDHIRELMHPAALFRTTLTLSPEGGRRKAWVVALEEQVLLLVGSSGEWL